ncbi:rod shape-determining protein [Methylacidimicrobium sp. B4]|uniref:rod shape-determining protein n=1 Tax=Methylacidimicrobium sp. B4 TaxID=2796139 RepID=UPI001F5C6926|nr:rod shape-determining protein [Methylacidimicrobium sp. B4]
MKDVSQLNGSPTRDEASPALGLVPGMPPTESASPAVREPGSLSDSFAQARKWSSSFWEGVGIALANDLGIDLGTANTLVYVRGRGIVLREPTVVAVNQLTKRLVAIGMEAKLMLGRTPINIQAVRPLKDGVISDFQLTERLLNVFIRKTKARVSLRGPRVVVAVPSGISENERRTVRQAARNAGAREVFLIEEPMAAAIGVGLPISEPAGNMIMDIGGGTTEMAIVALSDMVYCRSLRVGGDKFNESIMNYLRRVHNMMIGEATAEEIKIQIGSAFPMDPEIVMEVRGQDLVAGRPMTLALSSAEVREGLSQYLAAIVEAVHITVEHCPPELCSDLLSRGIVVAGGGALLRGIDRYISQETSLPVHIADDPLNAVVMGTGRVLEDEAMLQTVARADGRG